MIKKKNESGRSMVEMLGVLAIIGVLSIGGIAGYTLSMRRHRANQVVDALNKYSLIVYSACQKAVVNGDISTIAGCNSDGNYVLSYADSGLAPISELFYIGAGYIPKENTDTVVIGVNFRDLAICNAAKSIVGSKDTYDCTGNGSNAMSLKFKQN